MGLIRTECTQAMARLAEIQAKAKFWHAQTHIAAQTELRILLTKVDAVANQINQLEKSHHDARRQIVGLQDSRRDLQAQLAAMVPVSELQAARAEAGKLRELMDGLNQLLQAVRRKLRQKLLGLDATGQNAIAPKTEGAQRAAARRGG